MSDKTNYCAQCEAANKRIAELEREVEIFKMCLEVDGEKMTEQCDALRELEAELDERTQPIPRGTVNIDRKLLDTLKANDSRQRERIAELEAENREGDDED